MSLIEKDMCGARDDDHLACCRDVGHPGRHLSQKVDTFDPGCLNPWGVLKTSQEWCEATGVLVLDPDGWDRLNLEDSWSEKITQEEFERRLMNSTIDIHGGKR